MRKYINREIESGVLKRMDAGFIVAILGARQVGKTTLLHRIREILLSQGIPPSHIFFFSFDDPILRAQVSSNFHFIKNYMEDALGKELKEEKETIYLFLDEAQKVPVLFELVKIFYDTYKGKLRIIISGSASLQIQKKVVETLAGRVSYLYLFPFSIKEIIQEKTGMSLGKSLWEDWEGVNLKTLQERQSYLFRYRDSLEILLRKIILEGTMPPIFTRESKEEKNLAMQSFVSTYLDKDIRSLGDIGELDNFSNLLRLLAFEIGGVVNLSSISRDLGISINTLKKYLSVMRNTFVINPLSSYSGRERKKIVKAKKLYFFDVGVANYLARREYFEHLSGANVLGVVFENILLKSFESFNKNRPFPYDIYFFRDYQGHEVDFLIESSSGLVGVEVTYHEHITQEKKKVFECFFRNFPGAKAMIVYRGRVNEVNIKGNKVLCVPWWLWW
ncbi:ATP-binding protein [Candidatus Calescamantes bacterium]|nr:ATP-binding protein [Candidatus Calescamantes bacterium]